MRNKKYTNPRPQIPVATKREIKIEARHSCLVCKERVSLVLHHIDGNRENNDSDNIINICSNCHGMVHDGKITAIELREYKRKVKEGDEELIKLREAVSYLLGSKQISISSDFGKLKFKYQNLLNDYGDKLIFYQSFVFLIPEFYIDKRGEEIRAVVRDLLNLSSDEENMIITHLIRLDLIEIIGGLIILKNKDDAKTALNELINSHKIEINKLIKKFVEL
ncbi:MAG: HNH endonuclease signature motif containing protein [Patescibacteria group bacterium]|nr:HNH endonuclease signature motif containing protein [Patescibacteria group bacterium]MDD5164447.1 HNH endonuclease signature motif containing protein [Patescibacteria group bacterium]MDD5534366.1 HNH endonuclease signature motif containing protein [Patescibacteria group bacterium]